jgi:hypothetical protein
LTKSNPVELPIRYQKAKQKDIWTLVKRQIKAEELNQALVERNRKMSAHVTFSTGLAFTDEFLVIAGSPDEHEPFTRFTRVFQYQNNENAWTKDDEEFLVVSVAYFGPKSEAFDDYVVLSEDGDVIYVGDHDVILEKILGAGVNCDDWGGWGYVADIQQIGERLYVCGYKGQVYQRRGPNHWVHMDAGLLQDPDNTPMEKRIGLSAINGPHENAIYVAGYRHADWLPPCAFFWNGEAWRELELPPVAERLTNIYVENEARIWMCGSNGTLLLGNANDGFESLSTVEDNQLFLSLCMFQGKMYLGSNLGLFVYDPANHQEGILPVRTSLLPPLQDANVVDAVDDVLWSIGSKDIARFDGKKWTRIDHPDNPPIR